jgi:porin
VTYQAQITPWLQVQPDFQYVQRTGGGLPSPTNPERRLRDAVIVGVRTNINF